MKRESDIAIIGGGLVGGLAACFFARKGHHVIIYEYRSDIRVEDSGSQNINLALTFRGREALRAIGLEDALIRCHGTIMSARMIHNKNGDLKKIFYDTVNGNYLYCVKRRHLNMFLLDAAEKYPEVKLKFNQKLVDVDLEKGEMKFLNMKTGLIRDEKADLIIGADGAYSTVRKVMTKRPFFNYSQTYFEHGYVEFTVPSVNDNNNEFAMNGNYLHVWPHDEFMATAMPNDDYSFSGNLFATFTIFEKLKTSEALLNFFAEQFPDLLRLIDEEKLVEDFFKQEPKTLISIKCKPYHFGKTALLIGDAAHAMVPFYAQGLNTGFEDILLLDELMERYNSDFAKVLPEFSKLRYNDAHAICDLAERHFVEMKDKMKSKYFSLRNFLDNVLYALFPNLWIPLYNTVHFSRMNFCDCVANRDWQDKVLKTSFCCFGFLVLAILLFFYAK